MRRTKRPHIRKILSKDDISIQVIEKENTPLKLEISVKDLSYYKFHNSSLVFLEVFNRIALDRFRLGTIDDFRKEIKIEKKIYSFQSSERLKINFRLKIVKPQTSQLLGLLERFREDGYSESLLPIEFVENIEGISRINWDDIYYPILEVNIKLHTYFSNIKSIIVENAFKEILISFLKDDEIDSEILDESQWGQFIKNYNNSSENFSIEELRNSSWEDVLFCVNRIVGNFTEKLNLIEEIETLHKK